MRHRKEIGVRSKSLVSVYLRGILWGLLVTNHLHYGKEIMFWVIGLLWVSGGMSLTPNSRRTCREVGVNWSSSFDIVYTSRTPLGHNPVLPPLY